MNQAGNPLGTEPIGKLLRKFAVPSIISMLVMSLYNIVDQIFIGMTVGELGNGATNVAFPLSTLCIAAALAFGIGGASGFNLNMGAGNKKKAMYFIGNAMTAMFVIGIAISAIAMIFLTPLLNIFGATAKNLPFAQEYVNVTAFGFPFMILSAGGAHLVRADGSPKFSMYCNLSGAIVNIVLDYLFVIRFGWEMKGAAWATVIGQVISFIMVAIYLLNMKTGKLSKKHLTPKMSIIAKTFHLGMAQCLNQLAIMLVQIVMNNSLKYYGNLSMYGEDIPIACTGIIMKVNQIYFSVCIGISQGMQPIASFNRGAKKFDRLKETYKIALISATTVSVIAFTIFQLFPIEIIKLFGKNVANPDLYFSYSENFFRIFLFMTFLNGIQPITSTFCTAAGEPNRGTFLSLTRQIIFFIPFVLIFPVIFTKMGKLGIDGIMFGAPCSDFLAAVVSLIMIRKLFKKFKQIDLKNNY